MIETAPPQPTAPQSPLDREIYRVRSMARASFQRISENQYPNGLIPASVGRHDDEHFNGMVWIKDNVRAVRFAVDPLVRQEFPEFWDRDFVTANGMRQTADELYLSAMRGVIRIQGQGEQMARFASRPGQPDQHGYHTIDDRQAPAIKFNAGGELYRDWGHLQPDNWGTLLLESGKGIAQGKNLLEKTDFDLLPPGQILGTVLSFAANLQTERLSCRSIWEHSKCWSSYSTRRIVLAGLDQMAKVWPELVADSRVRDYAIPITEDELSDRRGSLREKVLEHNGADYTDETGHESSADLASLVVLNDIEIPATEKAEILDRIFALQGDGTRLENRTGFYRYIGDHWKKGRGEAKWTMGKPIVARHFAREALQLFEKSRHRARNWQKERELNAGNRHLEQSRDRVYDILEIIDRYGYFPELFENDRTNGIYRPNNNELAWGLGYLIEASGAYLAAVNAEEGHYS